MPTLTLTEYLVFATSGSFAETSSHTHGWKIIDYTPLRRRTRVGEDRPIPGAPGRLYVPREWDEQTVVLTWKINGRWDADGVAHSDPFDGVDLNHQVILDNVVNNLAARAVTFTDRHAATFDGEVVIEDWEPSVDPSSGGDQIISPMTLKIPAGWLAPS